MLTEAQIGVAATVHTYYHTAMEDPTPHMSAFLLARSEQWSFMGSTGWWDNSYHWSALYDSCRQCGHPLGPAKEDSPSRKFTRAFEGCNVSLDCSNTSACVGHLIFL